MAVPAAQERVFNPKAGTKLARLRDWIDREKTGRGEGQERLWKTARSKATIIPVALIIALGGILAAQQIAARWADLTGSGRWAMSLAELVPDEADAVVLINTRALAERDRSDTINRYRQAAADGGAKDFAQWLGESSPVTDETLRNYRATGLAWMRLSGEDGQGLIAKTAGRGWGAKKSDQASQDNTDDGPTGAASQGWQGGGNDNTLAWATTANALAAVTRYDSGKSIAGTTDFRRAFNVVQDANAVIAFGRWAALGEGLAQVVAVPLNCDVNKWIAAGIDIADSATVTVACPHPPGQWGGGPLQTAAAVSAEPPDAVVGATFRTTWAELENGTAGTPTRWLSMIGRGRDGEAAGKLLESLQGDAWFRYRETPEGDGWSMTLPVTEEGLSEAEELIGKLAMEQPNDGADKGVWLQHPAFAGERVRARVEGGALILGPGPATMTEETETEARVEGAWTGNAMKGWTRAVWPEATPWMNGVARVRMEGKVSGGLNIYVAEIEFAEEPTPP